MKSPAFEFPANFTWGTATAAPQIEGGAASDGKGPSTWDHFSRLPGRVANGDTLDVACDHYKRFAEDVSILRKLGIKNYRFSIAWPRILPAGGGAVNQPGLDFYRRLLECLRENGIIPWVTMFHWDLPQGLEECGGWRSRETVKAFEIYADTIVKALSPWVRHWITLNEIFCFTRLGYGVGVNAPGLQEPEQVVNQTYHHALLCHGLAVRAVRNYGGAGALVGLTDNPQIAIPFSETPNDIAAAESSFQEENIRVYDPLFHGKYSDDYFRIVGESAAHVEAGDNELISERQDFFGLNVYQGYYVREGANGRSRRLPFPPDFPRSSSSWGHLTPQAIYWAARHTHAYAPNLPIYITENGCGYDSDAVVDGECNDLQRREVVRSYLQEVHRAVVEGFPIRGYFLWSLLDNFEWSDGYQRRFGICHVDFKTQKRTPKLSAEWYSRVISSNRLL